MSALNHWKAAGKLGSEHLLPNDDAIANNEKTHSVVDIKLPGRAAQNPNSMLGTGDQSCSEESDETDSLISADSTSLLVDFHD